MKFLVCLLLIVLLPEVRNKILILNPFHYSILSFQQSLVRGTGLLDLDTVMRNSDVTNILKRLTFAAAGEPVYDSAVLSEVLQHTLQSCAGLSTIFNLFANAMVKRANDNLQYTVDRLNEAISFVFEKFTEPLQELSFYLDGINGMIDVAVLDVRDALHTLVTSLPTIDEDDTHHEQITDNVLQLGAAMSSLVDSSVEIAEGLTENADITMGEAAVALEVITETLMEILNFFLLHFSVFVDDMYGLIPEEMAALVEGLNDALTDFHTIVSNVPRKNIINENDLTTLAQFIIYSHIKITGTTSLLLIGNLHTIGSTVREPTKWPKIENIYCLKNFEKKLCATENICYVGTT